jgi:hypothetical protein
MLALPDDPVRAPRLALSAANFGSYPMVNGRARIAARFCDELAHMPALQREVHRYIHVYLTQLSQSAGCTRFHVVESRLARWLLMTQDRAHSPSFHITQEFLAFMLGVRRVGVTKAASALARRGFIRYRRGDITVIDRRGLKQAACGCYTADRRTYRQFLGLPRLARAVPVPQADAAS